MEKIPETLSFTVPFRAVPQGSMKGFPIRRKSGKMGVAITSDNKKLRPFRYLVSQLALEAVIAASAEAPVAPKGVAVSLGVIFYFLKPQSAKKRIHHTVKPDLSKLVRAIEDSGTGILWHDDCQICRYGNVEKLYGSPERVEISVRFAA